MEFTLDEVAAATGGKVVGGSVAVNGLAIDSRSLPAGSLFVALVAARDGHDFLDAAVDAGATAALISDGPARPDGLPAVVVDDTEAALTALGRAARARLTDSIVAITGSVGKTSVKDLARAAIGSDRSVHASEQSFNNEIGLPLTLGNAPQDVEALVLEMGARGVGHIAELCAVARPLVGLVTAVSHAHTELFGTIDDVAFAKGEMVESLPVDGTAVLNADDPRVVAMAERTQARVLTYGADEGAVRAADIVLDDDLRPSFTLHSPWGRAQVRLMARGSHNAVNAAGAAAAALALGVPLDAVADGLSSAEMSPWRMEVLRTRSGATVINDAYNANPSSVRAAMQSLVALPADRRVAVLGVMAELGADSDAQHEAIGALARDHGIQLISVGAPAYGGADVDTLDEAQAAMGSLGPDTAVLVKGSRIAGLEALASRLVDES